MKCAYGAWKKPNFIPKIGFLFSGRAGEAPRGGNGEGT